jgi:uncharacterized protein YecT (DUF1311 family)
MPKEAAMAGRALVIGLLCTLASPAAGAESYGLGNISGTITFPGESVPALRIYALALDGKTQRMIATPQDETRFTIQDIPAGRYHVVAYPYAKESASSSAVAWTRAAHCVKGPCDHSLIVVNVVAGKTANDVLLADWYVPAGVLPPDPAAPREKGPGAPDCEKENGQAARDACHLRAHEAADQAVNRHYERVMRALEPYPKCHEDLRNAQFAWLRFRDRHCAFEGATGEKGRTIRCLRELTEARAAYLEGQTALGCNR